MIAPPVVTKRLNAAGRLTLEEKSGGRDRGPTHFRAWASGHTAKEISRLEIPTSLASHGFELGSLEELPTWDAERRPAFPRQAHGLY